MHRLCVGRPRLDRLPDQRYRKVVESEPKSDGDPVVAVENAEFAIETEAKRIEDAPRSDVVGQGGQVTGSVDKGGTDDFAVHRAVSGNQCGRKPGDHRAHATSMHVS